MKTYIKCTVYKHDGTVTENPLRLSEQNLIVKLARESKWIAVEIGQMSKKEYDITFGMFR